MKKNWFKSSTTVGNPAQAGDAALRLHYGNCLTVINSKSFSRETTVHTQGLIDFNSSTHHGKDFTLEFWGVTKGLVQIPLTQAGSLYESIWARNFTKDDMGLFTHVVVKIGSGFIAKNVDETQRINIYRLNDIERYCITAKTPY